MKKVATKKSIKKKIYRNPKNKKKTTIYFKKGKKIIPKNYSSFTKKNHIHGIIKLLSSDYKSIKKDMKKFTHFNIQWVHHKPEKNYLIAKIDRKGFFDGNTYIPAIINGNNFAKIFL